MHVFVEKSDNQKNGNNPLGLWAEPFHFLRDISILITKFKFLFLKFCFNLEISTLISEFQLLSWNFYFIRKISILIMRFPLFILKMGTWIIKKNVSLLVALTLFLTCMIQELFAMQWLILSFSRSHFGQGEKKNMREPCCQVAHCVLFRKKGRKYYSRKIKISKLLSEAAHKQNKSVVWTILHFHPTRSWFYIKTD